MVLWLLVCSHVWYIGAVCGEMKGTGRYVYTVNDRCCSFETGVNNWYEIHAFDWFMQFSSSLVQWFV